MTYTEHFDHDDDNEGFDMIDLPTVVDIEFYDNDRMTCIYDASGQLVTFYYRDPGVLCQVDRITAMPEVANHLDQDLVGRIIDCEFWDGSSPLRILNIPHRYVDAYGHSSAKTDTLEAVGESFEILEIEMR